jgi:hypothetical protein
MTTVLSTLVHMYTHDRLWPKFKDLAAGTVYTSTINTINIYINRIYNVYVL